MKGHKLIQEVCENTDIPKGLLQRELQTLIERSHHTEDEITLDQLRELLAEYLQETLLQIKQELAG